MVSVFTGFAPLFVDLGTRDAIVQRRHLSEGAVSALFWTSVGIGVGLAEVITASGPLIAHFYGETRLTTIAAISSLTFVTAALSRHQKGPLRRVMRFHEVATAELIATLLSAGLAIAMAYYGYGYWALVVRPVSMNVFLAAAVWIYSGWVPGRPTFTSEVRDMLRFGLNSTGFTMSDFCRRSIDRVAVGVSRRRRSAWGLIKMHSSYATI